MTQASLTADFLSELSMCNRCGLRKGTTPVAGRGNKNKPLIMFVGEAPGRNEEKTGLPFVGVAGKILSRWIESLGISKDDYYVTNAVKCRPPSNRAPQFKETQTCKSWLYEEIKIIDPQVVVCLGRIAMFTMNGRRGYFVKSFGKPVFTMYHPMASLYDPRKEAQVEQHLNKLKLFLSEFKKEGFDLNSFLKSEEEAFERNKRSRVHN